MTIEARLTGVEETLLIPLWARASETRRPDAIVRDPRAVELVERIDYDFSTFARDWTAQLAIAIRTEIFDQAVGDFLKRHPAANVINLAAGLDTRFERLDNGTLRWWDVDLPKVTALRGQLIEQSERRRFIAGSVLDEDWLAAIDALAGAPTVIVIEGLLMYFDHAQIHRLFALLAARFPGADVVFEAYGTLATRNTWLFPSVSRTRASFKGGLDRPHDAEKWHPAISVVDTWFYLDRYPKRWGINGLARYIAAFRRCFKIVHVRLNQASC